MTSVRFVAVMGITHVKYIHHEELEKITFTYRQVGSGYSLQYIILHFTRINLVKVDRLTRGGVNFFDPLPNQSRCTQ